MFGPLLVVEVSKRARRCGAKMREAHLQVKMYKTHHSQTTFVLMSKKCTPLWREAPLQVKSGKNERYGELVDVQMSFCVAGAGACAPGQK